MTWNYRLVKHIDPDDTVVIMVHEVYYDGDGKPNAVTVDGIDVIGAGESEAEAVEDCRSVYHMMAEAFGKPVLDYETLGGAIHAEAETTERDQ